MITKKLLGIWLSTTFSILLGILFTVAFSYQYWRFIDTKSWKPVMGRVESTYLEETRTRKGRTPYCVRITYSFLVKGQRHTSTSLTSAFISNVGCFRGKHKAEKELGRFVAGQHLKIFFKPEDPSRSAIVLERPGFLDYFLLTSGGFFLGLGVYFGLANSAFFKRNKRGAN